MWARLSNKGQTAHCEGRTSVCLARGSNDVIMSMVPTNQPRDNDPASAHFRLTQHVRLSQSVAPTCMPSDWFHWVCPVAFVFCQINSRSLLSRGSIDRERSKIFMVTKTRNDKFNAGWIQAAKEQTKKAIRSLLQCMLDSQQLCCWYCQHVQAFWLVANWSYLWTRKWMILVFVMDWINTRGFEAPKRRWTGIGQAQNVRGCSYFHRFLMERLHGDSLDFFKFAKLHNKLMSIVPWAVN